MRVDVKKLNQKATIPSYKHEGDSGVDVHACIDESVVIGPGKTKLIPTGVAFAIPNGFEIQVRSRSGLSLKNGVVVLNSPGTVDAGFRDQIGVIMHNVSDSDFTVNHGDRIAQLVLCPVVRMVLNEVEELPTSQRGTNGFGSTGV